METTNKVNKKIKRLLKAKEKEQIKIEEEARIAARTGQVKKLKSLIDCHPNNIEGFLNGGADLLWNAASHNQAEVIQLLIEKNVDVNTRNDTDDKGECALHMVASKGFVRATKALLCAKGIQVDQEDNFGNTPLFNGIRFQSIVELLIAARANVNHSNKVSLTPLMLAANNGLTIVAQILIKSKAIIDNRTENGLTAAFFAAMEGHLDCLKLLKASGADLNATSKSGETILMAVIHAGNKLEPNFTMFQWLMNEKVNIYAESTANVSAIRLAARNGGEIYKAIFMQLWAKLVRDCNKKEISKKVMLDHMKVVLITAFSNGTLYIIDILLSKDSYRDIILMIKNQILEILIWNEECEGLSAFLKYKLIDINSCFQPTEEAFAPILKNFPDGMTPLMFATLLNKPKIIEVLLRNGANINTPCKIKSASKDDFYAIALYLASSLNHREIKGILFEKMFIEEATELLHQDAPPTSAMKNAIASISCFFCLHIDIRIRADGAVIIPIGQTVKLILEPQILSAIIEEMIDQAKSSERFESEDLLNIFFEIIGWEDKAPLETSKADMDAEHESVIPHHISPIKFADSKPTETLQQLMERCTIIKESIIGMAQDSNRFLDSAACTMKKARQMERRSYNTKIIKETTDLIETFSIFDKLSLENYQAEISKIENRLMSILNKLDIQRSGEKAREANFLTAKIIINQTTKEEQKSKEERKVQEVLPLRTDGMSLLKAKGNSQDLKSAKDKIKPEDVPSKKFPDSRKSHEIRFSVAKENLTESPLFSDEEILEFQRVAEENRRLQPTKPLFELPRVKELEKKPSFRGAMTLNGIAQIDSKINQKEQDRETKLRLEKTFKTKVERVLEPIFLAATLAQYMEVLKNLYGDLFLPLIAKNLRDRIFYCPELKEFSAADLRSTLLNVNCFRPRKKYSDWETLCVDLDNPANTLSQKGCLTRLMNLEMPKLNLDFCKSRIIEGCNLWKQCEDIYLKNKEDCQPRILNVVMGFALGKIGSFASHILKDKDINMPYHTLNTFFNQTKTHFGIVLPLDIKSCIDIGKKFRHTNNVKVGLECIKTKVGWEQEIEILKKAMDRLGTSHRTEMKTPVQQGSKKDITTRQRFI